MSIKKSISLIIVSALLVLPNGIAKAGDINVHTPGVRVTVGKDGGVNVQSGQTRVVTPPNRLLIPSYRRPLPTNYRTSTYSPKINQKTVCRGSTYSHQSTYTSGGSQTAQIQRSTSSTTVCR